MAHISLSCQSYGGGQMEFCELLLLCNGMEARQGI
jgi:hypothetical protein